MGSLSIVCQPVLIRQIPRKFWVCRSPLFTQFASLGVVIRTAPRCQWSFRLSWICRIDGRAARRRDARKIWLTLDVGHPKLRELLAGEIMLAKYSPNLEVFNERVDREYPQYGKTLPLPFPEKLQELIEEVSQ
jgi:hypothetical protein